MVVVKAELEHGLHRVERPGDDEDSLLILSASADTEESSKFSKKYKKKYSIKNKHIIDKYSVILSFLFLNVPLVVTPLVERDKRALVVALPQPVLLLT